MRQRGRKSAASIATLPINTEQTRLEPPADLSDAERTLFVETAAACSPTHFRRSDLPLLVAFVQAGVLSRHSARKLDSDPDALAVWERGTRIMAMLATRLRLAPQARMSPKTLAREPDPDAPEPWNIRGD